MDISSDGSIYIYKLPHRERRELCRILDLNDKWEELAGVYMNFEVSAIQDIRRERFRGQSPTDELLTIWGIQNHSVLELFILLSQMKHYQSMTILKSFVDPKYHTLIHDGQANLSLMFRNLSALHKDLGIPNNNFQNYTKQSNKTVGKCNKNQIAPAVQVHVNQTMISDENNETKIDNNNFNSSGTKTSTKLVKESAGLIPQIPYEELQGATNNWDSKNILGRGGFGTVFKGTWKYTQVAIKRIEKRDNSPENNIQLKQSITELHCLNAYRHDNVLPLYGYSVSGEQPCLVYQYMSGGCLEQRLRAGRTDQTKQLNWTKRLSIAKGTARGLQFLHTIGDKPLIHGDIKSANILLDQNDEPKIGDFGLAREGPHSEYTHMEVSRIHGTKPYLPDEFLRAKQISVKVDTYSYGVVLFEIATGQSAYSINRPKKYLKDHVIDYDENKLNELQDATAGTESAYYFYHLLKIGKICVSKKAKDRPQMTQVLEQLETIK